MYLTLSFLDKNEILDLDDTLPNSRLTLGDFYPGMVFGEHNCWIVEEESESIPEVITEGKIVVAVPDVVEYRRRKYTKIAAMNEGGWQGESPGASGGYKPASDIKSLDEEWFVLECRRLSKYLEHLIKFHRVVPGEKMRATSPLESRLNHIHVSGKAVDIVPIKDVILTGISGVKEATNGTAYFWFYLRDLVTDSRAARAVFEKHSADRGSSYWPIERAELNQLMRTPRRWVELAGESLQYLIIEPQEWLEDVYLGPKQFLPRAIVKMTDENLEQAVCNSRRRSRFGDEKGGAGPGWCPEWDLDDVAECDADEYVSAEDDVYDWERDYFDAMTDGHLGDYDDFHGTSDRIGNWSGR